MKSTVSAWAPEGHKAAVDRARILPEDRKLGENSYQSNIPIVEHHLANAGLRLAHVLDQTSEGKEPTCKTCFLTDTANP